jgi:hypothetical protein
VCACVVWPELWLICTITWARMTMRAELGPHVHVIWPELWPTRRIMWAHAIA